APGRPTSANPHPLYAAHHVMRRGTDLHRLPRDVDIAELFELVIHAGQLATDMLRGVRQLLLDPGDVQKDAAMGATPTFAHLAHDAPRHVIAGQQLRRTPRRFVALRVAPAFLFVIR